MRVKEDHKTKDCGCQFVRIYTGLFARAVFASSYSVSSLAAAGSLLFVGRCLLFVCVEMGHHEIHIVLLYADLMTSQKLLSFDRQQQQWQQ